MALPEGHYHPQERDGNSVTDLTGSHTDLPQSEVRSKTHIPLEQSHHTPAAPLCVLPGLEGKPFLQRHLVLLPGHRESTIR